jgi:hypothetical protein
LLTPLCGDVRWAVTASDGNRLSERQTTSSGPCPPKKGLAVASVPCAAAQPLENKLGVRPDWEEISGTNSSVAYKHASIHGTVVVDMREIKRWRYTYVCICTCPTTQHEASAAASKNGKAARVPRPTWPPPPRHLGARVGSTATSSLNCRVPPRRRASA